MEDINYIYELISKSNVTLIGYTYKVERIKDEFISKLPCFKLGEISSSFSFKSYMRDIKLNQILEDVNYFKYIVLDIGDIKVDKDPIYRVKMIKKIVSNIREDMYKIYTDDDLDKKFEPPYRLIITTTMYKSPTEYDINNFTGGYYTDTYV